MDFGIPSYRECLKNHKIPLNTKTDKKYPAYGQHLALLYMCDSGVPILYCGSMSIPWVFSIP